MNLPLLFLINPFLLCLHFVSVILRGAEKNPSYIYQSQQEPALFLDDFILSEKKDDSVKTYFVPPSPRTTSVSSLLFMYVI